MWGGFFFQAEDGMRGRVRSRRLGDVYKRQRLEQLRALEDGMRIDAEIVSSVPLGVDTPEDLALSLIHI